MPLSPRPCGALLTLTDQRTKDCKTSARPLSVRQTAPLMTANPTLRSLKTPLAIWVETRLGLKEVNRKPLRASPKSLKDAAKILSDEFSAELRCL